MQLRVQVLRDDCKAVLFDVVVDAFQGLDQRFDLNACPRESGLLLEGFEYRPRVARLGEDMSDLNRLLLQLQDAARRPSRRQRWLHWLRHAWAVARDCGKTVYERCAVCGKRRAWQRWPGRGAQPIDEGWVETGEWHRPRQPGGAKP